MATPSGDFEMPMVTCLRCGASYPEGAVVCFRCGAPIGEVSSATQPVRPHQAIPPTPPTASSPVPLPVEQDQITTAPRLAAVAVATKPIHTRSQRWERRARVLLGTVILLVVAGAVAGAVVGVKALLAGSNVPQSTTYQDPQHRFRFLRPTLWTATSLADGVLVTDSDGTSTLQVTVATPSPGETALSRANTMAQAQDLVNDDPQSFAGETWQRLFGNVTGRDGAVREIKVYISEHNGQIYIIQLASPLASFNGIENLVYQPMLASFQFA